jgi:hypothetical protein
MQMTSAGQFKSLRQSGKGAAGQGRAGRPVSSIVNIFWQRKGWLSRHKKGWADYTGNELLGRKEERGKKFRV